MKKAVEFVNVFVFIIGTFLIMVSLFSALYQEVQYGIENTSMKAGILIMIMFVTGVILASIGILMFLHKECK